MMLWTALVVIKFLLEVVPIWGLSVWLGTGGRRVEWSGYWKSFSAEQTRCTISHHIHNDPHTRDDPHFLATLAPLNVSVGSS